MTNNGLSVKGLVERHLEENLAWERVMLDFGGFVVQVDSNSALLTAKLGFYYREFLHKGNHSPEATVTALELPAAEPSDLGLEMTVNPPEPGKSGPKEEFCDLPDGRVIRKIRTGMLFFLGQKENLAVGRCIENGSQLINFINSRFTQWALDRGCFLIHSAGVAKNTAASREGGVVNAGGLALAGNSGMGKSSLALRMLELGADFVSNDRLLLFKSKSRLIMYGLAKAPRVNPGAIVNTPSLHSLLSEEDRARYQKMDPAELWPLEMKFDAHIDRYFGENRFRLSSELTGLVVLNWDPARVGAGKAVLNKIDLSQRTDLLDSFVKPPGLFYLEKQSGKRDFSPQSLVKLLEATPVYELSGPVDFPGAAKACMELIA